MKAKDLTSRLAKVYRRFRATSIGEFSVALVLSAVLGTSFVGLLFAVGPYPARAVDATWLGFAGSDWNSDTNWSGGLAPVTTNDTATFNTSSNTLATLSSNVTIQSITFTTNALPFTILTSGNTLALQGAGIVNNSTTNQTISNNPGATTFTNSSTAGNATINNNNEGTTQFFDTSNAGGATINNQDSIEGGFGSTAFFDNSTAATATITNFGRGSTLFFDNSTAGSATITNFGATSFFDTSSGGSAAIDNFATVSFFDTSNAGSSTMNNFGSVFFFDNSSAGNAAISSFGETSFFGNSTAGNATIDNFTDVSFFDTSSAGNATIDNLVFGGEGSGFGTTTFFGNSTAGSATMTNEGGIEDSTLGAFTQFSDTSNAGSATIINNGGTVAEAQGGSARFGDASNAGSAAIINDGAAVSGASGGFTEFSGASNAGSATIINNAGTNGGSGGFTTFLDFSDGGTARVIANGNGALDISGLTATGMGVGSIEGSGVFSLGSKSLTVGGNNLSTTVSGLIQDGGISGGAGGSLTKVGSGTLTLIGGGNTYTGGTNLDGGILAVNSDLNLGTGPLSFNGGTLEALGSGGGITSSKAVSLAVGGGTFLADAGTTSTLNGLISGVGGWTKAGPGVLMLTNANTYSGGTTIAGGTILTQNSSALGTGPVAFGNGSALQVQDLLNVNGNWTVLPGAATVSGGTVQTLGGFSLGGGGTLIANANFNVPGAANINSSGFVVNSVFTVRDSVNLSGSSAAVINGALASAAVNVNNASSLTVNNAGTVAANVNVGPSALVTLLGAINGNIINAGTFQGNGVANGNVINSGLVSPGTSIGKLTINGNYTQNPSGALRIEVAGSSQGQYDVLAVNGRANLAGTLQLVRVGGFNLRVGDQIIFLTARDGVSGTFSTIENNLLATDSPVAFDVIYLPNFVVLGETQGVVILEATQISFEGLARTLCGTPNSIAVGQALDSAVNDPRASELINFLNSRMMADLCEDFDLISPEQLTSIFVVGVSLANVQTANLERRMDDIQRGSTGFSSSGLAISGSGPSFSEGFAGVSGPEGKSGQQVFAPIPQNRWGVFVTGLGEFTNVDSTFNASGYDLATGGFTMGIDYRIGSHFAIGLTGGYAYTGADLVNDSSIAVNGGKLGLYATAFGGGFYLDTAVIGGLDGYDTRRTALEGTASGETIGGNLNVLVAAGYDWRKGGFSIGPTASFQYTLVGFDDFAESGSLAPLAYPAQNAESYRTALGIKTSYAWKIGSIQLVPEVRVSWQHEFGDTDYSLVSNLASGAGNSFTVNGPEIGRDSMLLGAGFAIHWNERISTYAYYDGELFRTNYLSNNVSAGFRLTF